MLFARGQNRYISNSHSAASRRYQSDLERSDSDCRCWTQFLLERHKGHSRPDLGAPLAMTPARALAGAAQPTTSDPQAVSAAASADPLLPINYSMPLRITIASREAPVLYGAVTMPEPVQPVAPFARLATLASGGVVGDVGGFNIQVHNGMVGTHATDFRLEMTRLSSLMDMRLEIQGDKSLQQGTGMALTYDGTAFLFPDAPVELGVVSKGGMGTLGDPAPIEDDFAGPAARLCLPGLGWGPTAETSFLFKMAEKGIPARNQFSMRLNLAL